jgi:hypothetical protein
LFQATSAIMIVAYYVAERLAACSEEDLFEMRLNRKQKNCVCTARELIVHHRRLLFEKIVCGHYTSCHNSLHSNENHSEHKSSQKQDLGFSGKITIFISFLCWLNEIFCSFSKFE